MDPRVKELIDRLESQHSLSEAEYTELLQKRDASAADLLAQKAVEARKRFYKTDVYVRGLIEFSNTCKNDCFYCGIRCGNKKLLRYRLDTEELIACTERGYELGFRTFVLQSGEDPFFSDDILCPFISWLRKRHPDCAVTLSIGERSRDSYQRLFDAGAERYLLRHETASKEHYGILHPASMSFDRRMQCLRDLRDIGYAVGAGFMTGSPFQTEELLAKDLKFIEEFRPEMCGIGPFIPHRDTPFADKSAGTAELTCYLLSIIRLIRPNILLPSTTALNTICPDGWERGIQSGANVVMPNITPKSVRKNYVLYNGKNSESGNNDEENVSCIALLEKRMQAIGYRVALGRGDIRQLEK